MGEVEMDQFIISKKHAVTISIFIDVQHIIFNLILLSGKNIKVKEVTKYISY